MIRCLCFLLMLLVANVAHPSAQVTSHEYGQCIPTITQFLTQQFSSWHHNKMSTNQLDAVSKLPKDVLEAMQLNRIQFIDGEFYGDINASWGGAWQWLYAIKEAHKKHHINNFDAFIACGDAVSTHDVKKYNDILTTIPIFHINKLIADNGKMKNVILLPGDYTITDSLVKTYQEIDKKQVSWQNKKPLIGWRGMPSDGKYRLENIANLTRLKLVILSSIYPDYIDAKFVKPKKSPIIKALASLNITTNDFVPPADMLEYKYLVSLDGSASTFTRIPWVMYSQSTMLFQSKWTQWFFPALKPWVHYVPLQDDLSDLLERYHWLQNHDHEAQTIAENAKKFVLECLGKEQSLNHLAVVLNEYATIQNFHLTTPTLQKIENNNFSIPLHTTSFFGQIKFRFWRLVRQIQSYNQS